MYVFNLKACANLFIKNSCSLLWCEGRFVAALKIKTICISILHMYST